jgi:hypothetical protein
MKTALRIVALVLLTVLCVLLVWLNIESIKNSFNYLAYLEEMIKEGIYEENDVAHERTIRIINIIYSILNLIYQVTINVVIALFIVNPCIFIFKFKSLSGNYNENNQIIQQKQEEKIEKKIAKLQEKLNKIEESE